MFQFSPLASVSLWIQEQMTRHDPRRVSPFGHLRITAYVRLPEAFRSLSRPSSPVRAKASTVRPCSLGRYSLQPARYLYLQTTHTGARVALSATFTLPSTLVVNQLVAAVSSLPRAF